MASELSYRDGSEEWHFSGFQFARRAASKENTDLHLSSMCWGAGVQEELKGAAWGASCLRFYSTCLLWSTSEYKLCQTPRQVGSHEVFKFSPPKPHYKRLLFLFPLCKSPWCLLITFACEEGHWVCNWCICMCIFTNLLAGGRWLQAQVWKYYCLRLIEFVTSGRVSVVWQGDYHRQVGAELEQTTPPNTPHQESLLAVAGGSLTQPGDLPKVERWVLQ